MSCWFPLNGWSKYSSYNTMVCPLPIESLKIFLRLFGYVRQLWQPSLSANWQWSWLWKKLVVDRGRYVGRPQWSFIELSLYYANWLYTDKVNTVPIIRWFVHCQSKVWTNFCVSSDTFCSVGNPRSQHLPLCGSVHSRASGTGWKHRSRRASGEDVIWWARGKVLITFGCLLPSQFPYVLLFVLG